MFAGRGMAVLQCANRSMAGSVSMPVAVAARAAANRTAVPGPQPTSTTRSAPVNSAASATARTRGPCPAAIHSAVMTRQARPAIPAPARRVLVLLTVDHRPPGAAVSLPSAAPGKMAGLDLASEPASSAHRTQDGHGVMPSGMPGRGTWTASWPGPTARSSITRWRGPRAGNHHAASVTRILNRRCCSPEVQHVPGPARAGHE